MAITARPTARARGYTTAWDKARAGYLATHPHCAMCTKQGAERAATVVDHITPHRGDQRLFWDKTNWQGLCSEHHSSDKQQMEKRGFSARIDASGLPVDRSHPFYAGDDTEASHADARQRPRQARPASSRAVVGGSEVAGSKGGGPLGFKTSELVPVRGRRDG